MYKPKSIYTKLALFTIENYFKRQRTKEPEEFKNSSELKIKKACFVSLHTLNAELRGCIGTILPYRENLYQEIAENAISAAVKDPRFQPMVEEEVENIELSVDVLSIPEEIKDISELDVKNYGIIVEKGFRKGVLLPNLETIDTVEEQIRIAKLKAGIYDVSNAGIKIYKFLSERFY